MEALIQELGIANHVLAAILGVPRLLLIFQIAPFLGGAVLTGPIRTMVVLSFYAILHPTIVYSLPEYNVIFNNTFDYLLIILKEALLGTILGLLVGILFWGVQSAGYLIDLQRGGSQFTETDMSTGESTTPFGTFFFQSLVIMFFITGGFLIILQAIYNSYLYWPVTSFLPVKILLSKEFALFFASQTANVLLIMILFSGPILIACLLADLSLGLISRFATQLNVYILSMPVKSGIASFLAIFYLAILLKFAEPRFGDIVRMLEQIPSLL